MGELARAIIKIVKSDPDLGNQLGNADEKGAVKSTRGIAYHNAEGAISAEAGADPSTDDVTGGTVGGYAGATGSTGYSTINLNTPEGMEYIPPDGWSDPDTGLPTEDAHLDRRIRTCTGTVMGYYTDSISAENAATAWIAAVGAGLPDPAGGPTRYTEIACGETIDMRWTAWRANNSTDVWWWFDPFTAKAGTELDGNGCPVGSAHINGQCLIPDPAAEWPSDGVCSIARVDGQLTGHSRDPDCSAQQKTPASCQIINQNGAAIRVCLLANGGAKITPVDSAGVPTSSGITKVLDASGVVVGFYDATSQTGLI
jgi:hypothetical protein